MRRPGYAITRRDPPGARTPERLQLAAVVIVLATAGCVASPASVDEAFEEQTASGFVTTRELVELRQISSLAVSPDQARAVIRVDQQIVDTASTKLTWRVIDLATGVVTGRVGAGDPLWNSNAFIAGEMPQWSSDSAWIYFRRLGGEELQLWRVRPDGSALQQLTSDPADVVGFCLNDDGSVMYAVSGATRSAIKSAEAAEYASGTLMSAQVISGYRIAGSFPVNGRMATTRYLGNPWDGRRATLLGDRPLRVMRMAAAGGAPIQVDGAEAQAFLAQRRLAPGLGGSTDIAVVKPAHLQSGYMKAYTVEVDAKAPGQHPRSGQRVTWRSAISPATETVCDDKLCTEPDNIQIVGWRPGKPELILQSEEQGISRLLAWDTSTAHVREVWKGPGVIGSSESGTTQSCQLALDRVVCVAASGDRPPRVVAFDLATGAVETLYDPNPRLTPSRLGSASQITLTDHSGSTTIGTVIRPGPEAGHPSALPLVITSYGCRGFLQGGSGRDVPEHVLASRGYVALCVDLGFTNVRRAPGLEVTHKSLLVSGTGFFENAVEQLTSAGAIDPERVLLSGFSGSATNTAYAITRSNSFTAAIVTTGGSMDAGACYQAANYRSCEQNAKREGYGRPYDTRDGYLKDSPAWNADKIRAPLLMQLPESEYAGMKQLYGALLEYDRATEMYVFADAFHYKNNPRQRLAVYDRNVAWADFWLKGVETSSPDHVGQYERWNRLREGQCALPELGAEPAGLPWYCRGTQ